MAGYIPRRFTCPRAVTRSSNNRAQCRLTTLTEAKPLHNAAAQTCLWRWRQEQSVDTIVS